jgi:amino acid adenylation domain-containing protein/thioester reductase-like protein
MYKVRLSPYAKIFFTEWLLDPDSFRYNLVIDQILYGDLDVTRLRTALKKYITDHVVLNSHIQEINGEPHWAKNDQIFELDYSDYPINSDELFGYVSHGFDLYNDPLYRFKLVKIEPRVYRFIVVIHHIAMDGSSVGAGLFEAIPKYYNDKDYVTEHSIDSQIKLLTNLTEILTVKLEHNEAEHKEFWNKQLSDIEPVDLTFLQFSGNNDEKISTLKSSPIKEIRFSYGEAEATKLNQIKRRYIVTPYIYSLCIFALILNRYTNQERLAISYPTAIKEGLDFIYGAQVNTNLIPYQFNQTTTIVDLFNQSRAFFSALKHSDTSHSYYPIVNILHDHDSHLLNISFIQPHFKDSPFTFQGITKVEVQAEFNLDSADLFVFEQDLQNHLNYRVRYNKKIISEELIKDFVDRYQRLFLEILEDVLNGDIHKSISSYNLLNQQQYQQLVYGFNQTEKDYPRDKTIHQLFEEQVIKTPGNIAVVYENTKLTYNELNNKANQLAHYLLNKYEIKPDDLIILCLVRSELMLVAILAILKTGAAYVPIDYSYPNNRIKHVLADTKAEIVLTNDIHKNKWKQIITRKTKNADVVVIDNKKTQNKLAKQKTINPVTASISANLIYVIYTSGTTGNPKGVMIEHKNIINLLVAMQSLFLLREDDKFLGSSSVTFDIAGAEIYLPLINGAQVIIIDNNILLDTKTLVNFIENSWITYMQATPSLWSTLIKFGWKGYEDMTIISTGEKLSQELAEALAVDVNKLWNLYGPTETTIWSTTFLFKSGNNIYMGNPIANTQIFILDNYKNIVPIGAIGEMYVGGDGIARGYLNQPKLTEEKFIINPFQTDEEKTQDKNNRLYKTGDLVRMLPDGNLEYIGRNDFQVKIRGHRIELSEIESQLLHYPEIQQVVVLVKEYIGDKYLVAYYVAENKLEETQLRSYLAMQLYDYMIPRLFIHLNKLPLTGNGKLDRNALLELQCADIQQHYIAPNNEQEQFICEIFAKILGVEQKQVSADANFFELGGNSLKAISLVFNLQSKLDVKVPDIFNLRTPKNIAANTGFGSNVIIQKLEQIKLTYKHHSKKTEITNFMLQQKIDNYLKSVETLKVDCTLSKPITNVLLTGATGYLGCNLLNQLLKLTNYCIFLLVRGDSQQEAFNRVNKKFKFYFDQSLDILQNKRVFVLKADIEEDYLGLSADNYQILINNIDSIIHSAALVKHYGAYDQFYSANVLATINLLELAKLTKTKDFHYISTYALLNFGYTFYNEEYVYTEDDIPNNVEDYFSVYTKTKLLGEHQVVCYRNYGINGNIYRVGNLAFISENYRVQENIEDNAFFILLKGLLAIQQLNPEINIAELVQIDLGAALQAVDYTAQAIVKLFDKALSSNEIYHVFSSEPFNLSLILSKENRINTNIQKIDVAKLIDNIIYCLNDKAYHDVVLRFLLYQGWLDGWGINNHSLIKILQCRTQHILAQLEFEWPFAANKALDNYIRLLKLSVKE